MENVIICLILMLILVGSGIISRVMPRLPLPIIQIILGAMVSLFLPDVHIGFNPEVFMLLFIPPLLFNDSWHFPKREFILNTRYIIMLSIGLVFFSVAGIGYLVHWLVPGLPLANAFILAAALAPTDAVALKSMTAKAGMPGRMRHILQGEALLNDASSLVSFKFAVAAMLTGLFSMTDATISLFVVSAGGILVGVALTWVFISILGNLTCSSAEETSTENLILILLPYAAWLSAEHFGFSGIIAAVSAGFTVDKAGFLDKTMATMRIEGRFVWGMLETTLNGIIFILLGLFLPKIATLLDNSGYSIANYLILVPCITLALSALRFLWIYLTFPFEIVIARHKNQQWYYPNLKIVTAISFGGIRGAISLAAILSLPTLMPDGSPFPLRDLLIILVAGVVLCSLLSSTVILPIILPTLKGIMSRRTIKEDEEIIARAAAAQAGIRAVEQKMEELMHNLGEEDAQLCLQTGNALLSLLNRFIVSEAEDDSEKNQGVKALAFEESLRLAALEGARNELRRLRKNGDISNTAVQSIIHRLDLRQISLEGVS